MPRTPSLEEIQKRIADKHRGVVTIKPESYVGVSKKASFVHAKYGEWDTVVANVLSGCSHPAGASQKIREKFMMPIEEVEKRIEVIHGNRVTIIKDSYERVQAVARFVDEEYGEWDAWVCNILKGAGHPKRLGDKRKSTCMKKYGVEFVTQDEEILKRANESKYATKGIRSKEETEITSWLDEHGISSRTGCVDGTPFDVIIDDLKICIEFNGLYWHSSATGKKKNYHLNKTEKAEKAGYRCVHIFSHEWRDRKDQIKGFLLSACKKNSRLLHMRKVDLKPITTADACLFLDAHHIQGRATRVIKAYGVFTKERELVGVATFSHHHRKEGVVVLSRWVCKYGVSIAGALSKISKTAAREINGSLCSWCDLRWSQGTGYKAAGWQQDAVLPPDYFYYRVSGVNTHEVISKQSRMKSVVNTPEGMTEAQHAAQDGLATVWDCGKIRFVFNV
jgi:hypothetical protein